MDKLREAEEAVQTACNRREIPGLILAATNRDGTFTYSRAFGRRSVRPNTDQSPLEYDSIHWIASCTKLLTSLAAMQCVERGTLSLSDPVYATLPELKDRPVIRGFTDDGAPILSAHTTPITLRHLLTHSSGIAYDETHPKLLAWLKWRGERSSRAGTVLRRFDYPMVFEPGENWCYGAGIDWAGRMVGRVSGGITLQAYFEKYIFAPLGIVDFAFEPYMKERPAMLRRKVDMSKRDPEDWKVVKRSNAWLQYMSNEDCFGGLGCWASAPEFLKVLKGLLASDVDEVLLKKESVEEFFRPALTEMARTKLNKYLQAAAEMNNGMGGMPSEIVKDYGLGGMVSWNDDQGGRRAGSMWWGGMANWMWWIDRKTGICGMSAAQLLPPGDEQIIELTRQFEKGVYKALKSPNPKL